METSEVNENLKGEIRSWGKGLVFIGVIQIISMKSSVSTSVPLKILEIRYGYQKGI